MSELEDRLSSILSDPEQMARISSLAQSLMGGETAPFPAGERQEPVGGGPGGALGSLLSAPQKAGGDPSALLKALQPFLSEKRRQKLGRAMRLARMASLARVAMGEMGNGETL